MSKSNTIIIISNLLFPSSYELDSIGVLREKIWREFALYKRDDFQRNCILVRYRNDALMIVRRSLRSVK